MSRVKGNLTGLKPSVLRAVQRLYERRVGVREFVTAPFAQALQDAAIPANRRVGVLADRRGVVRQVVVGGPTELEPPGDVRRRVGPGRLCGLRWIHTRLDGSGTTRSDLATLRLFSLDASVAVVVTSERMPAVEVSYLLPVNSRDRLWEALDRAHPATLGVRFDETLVEIETGMRRDRTDLWKGDHTLNETKDAAILVLPVTGLVDVPWESGELRSLCRTADLAVADLVIQRRNRPDPRTLIGRGKLREVTMLGLQKGADLLVFGTALTPSQQRNVARETGVRVVDRNQLILDIFARHARTNEGRLQVELAQLRYNLPRLSEKDDAISRLTGGIGALGPGETKLEMVRRRARDRIHFLEDRIRILSVQRAGRRKRRIRQTVPVVSLVGYTNAGKSTLFNAVTGASVATADRLFATLDPTTRRVRFPDRREFLLSDTVGFIRDLPEELVGSFRATLEEVGIADLLILVADASDPHLDEQIASVRRIIRELGLNDKPTMLALNKVDLVADAGELEHKIVLHGGIPVSGLDPSTLGTLMARVQECLSSIPPARVPSSA